MYIWVAITDKRMIKKLKKKSCTINNLVYKNFHYTKFKLKREKRVKKIGG